MLLRAACRPIIAGRRPPAENWQRLDPERLPGTWPRRFAFRIDPAFRDAQPPETQKRLQGVSTRPVGAAAAAAAPWRPCSPRRTTTRSHQAFRQAEGLLPGLKRNASRTRPSDWPASSTPPSLTTATSATSPPMRKLFPPADDEHPLIAL